MRVLVWSIPALVAAGAVPAVAQVGAPFQDTTALDRAVVAFAGRPLLRRRPPRRLPYRVPATRLTGRWAIWAAAMRRLRCRSRFSSSWGSCRSCPALC